MKYFADTWFWAALLNPKDGEHDLARQLMQKVGAAHIFTSQLVMVELLGFFCKHGGYLRSKCCQMIRSLNASSAVTVVPYSDAQYDRAFLLYEKMKDKKWSLVDCASFVIMDDQAITVAITGDKHFTERGFQLLTP